MDLVGVAEGKGSVFGEDCVAFVFIFGDVEAFFLC